LYIAKCPYNKIKILWPAMIGLKESFLMICIATYRLDLAGRSL